MISAWVEGEPKTQAGMRTVSIPPELSQALHRERARQAERRLRLGEGWQDRSLVFSNDTGGVLHPSVVAHRLRAASDALGLPRLTPHGLRHLSASLLIAQNVPLPNVSRRLGHGNPGITARIYSHAANADWESAQVLQRVLGVTPSAKSSTT